MPDCMIRVHVLEGRDLAGKDASGTSDPFCQVEVKKKKERTGIVKKSASCYWDHLMHFEFESQESTFLTTAIRVAVYDANAIKRNTLIGEYTLDVAYVRDQPGHELYRGWVALFKAGATEAQGFVRLSVLALMPGEQPPTHTESEDEDEEGDSLSGMVLMPPALSLKPHRIRMKVYLGEDLPKVDRLGKCDAYLELEYAGASQRTSIQKSTLRPTWNEEVILPAYLPQMASRINISVYDYDRGSKDDLIGLHSFDINEVIGKAVKPRWINFYGPSHFAKESSQVAQAQLHGEIEGTEYRGRILLGLKVEEVAQPKADVGADLLKAGTDLKKQMKNTVPGAGQALSLVSSVTDTVSSAATAIPGVDTLSKTDDKTAKATEEEDIVASTLPIPPYKRRAPEAYSLFVDLYKATELDVGATSQVSATISVGSNMAKSSKQRKSSDGSVKWQEQCKGMLSIPLPPEIDEVPDVFITVFKKDALKQPVGYVRMKASDVISQNFHEEPTWVMLKPDPGVTKGTFAGFFSFRMSFMRANNVRVERPRLVDPSTVRMQLRLYLYQGRALPAADDNGLSDPYCVARWCGGSARSKTVSESVHPLWYETVVLEVDAPSDLAHAPDVLVVCYDYDRMSADDALGAFVVPIKNLIPTRGTNYRSLPRPVWRPLVPLTGKRGSHGRAKNGLSVEEECGAILAGCRLMPMEIAEALPAADTSIIPKSVECEVEVAVVGLRNLAKFRHMAIQRPFIELDAGDRSDKSKIARTSSTDSGEGGSPGSNMLQTLSIPAKLPFDPLFCPTLNVKVFDVRMGGHSKPLIGTVSIWLESYMSWIPKAPGAASNRIQEIEPASDSVSPEKGRGAAELGAGVGGDTSSADKEHLEMHEQKDDEEKQEVKDKYALMFEDDSGDEDYVPPPAKPVKDKYSEMFEDDSEDEDDMPPFPTAPPKPEPAKPEPAKPKAAAAPTPTPEVGAGVADQKWDEQGPEWESDNDVEADIETGLLGSDDQKDFDDSPSKKKGKGGGGMLARLRARKSGYAPVGEDEPVVASGGELLEATDDDESDAEEDVVYDDHGGSTTDGSIKGKSPKRVASQVKIRRSKTADPDDPIEQHPLCEAELEMTFSEPDFFTVPIFSGKLSGKKKRNSPQGPMGEQSEAVENLIAGGRGQAQVGNFKGQIRVLWEGAQRAPAVDLKTLFKPREYVVRAYVLKGHDLMSKDEGGLSDPFVEIQVGNGKGEGQRIYDVEHKIMDTSNPEWFATYQLPAVIPGESTLKITIYDWDAIGSNDLIGSTSIDLESRLFNKEWKAMEPRPREMRALWSPQSSLPQGKIELWVDIFTKEEAAKIPPIHIGPPEPKPYDMRIVVWDTADCVAKDEKTDSSDIFVACQMDIEGSKRMDTDVHWKAKGEGLFNYRLIVPVAIPCKVPRLRIAAWDRDLVGEDDLIGEAVLNLASTFRKVEKRKNKITSLKKQWVTLRHPNFKDDQGRVLVSLDIVPDDMAKENPVGTGQRDPNTDPHLDPPKRPPGAINPMRVDLVIAYHLKKAYRYALVAILIIVGLLIAVLAYVVKKKVLG